MRTITLFLLLFTFVSCGFKIPKYVSASSFIDYSYFTDKGIYVSESNSVNFDYTPMGSIDVWISSSISSLHAEIERISQGGKLKFTHFVPAV
jgi:hypothetical protein